MKINLNFKTSSKTPKRFDGLLLINKRLIKKEAYLGGQLFGALNKGHRREFFCLDENTWILHEIYTDSKTKQKLHSMLRYDICFNQSYKKQDNNLNWQKLSQQEDENLKAAIKIYRHNVLAKLYPSRNWI